MPRGMGPFDYLVPETLKKEIKVGQLVKIPLRKSEIFGLVLSLGDMTNVKGLKTVLSIVHSEPIVLDKDLVFFKQCSDLYSVSIGTIAKMSLLPMQKRKLLNISLTPLSSPKRKKGKTYIRSCKDLSSLDTYIQEQVSKHTLILVPEVRYVEHILSILSQEQQKNTAIWHSSLTTKQQFDQWMAIRNKEKEIVIGTRGAALLPIPELSKIIIYQEQDDNHKHWDQAPRFHTKDIALIQQELNNIDLHLVGTCPSVSSYYDIHKHRAEGTLDLAPIDARIVNMQDERKGGNYDALAEVIKDALVKTSGDVLFLTHRLGYASSIGCRTCGFVATCPMCKLPYVYHEKKNTLACHYCKTHEQVAKQCPTCASMTMNLRGAGSELIETMVRKVLGSDQNTIILRIDSEQPLSKIEDQGKRRILIGTRMALKHVRWDQTDLVCITDADTVLHIPEYTAATQIWQEISSIAALQKDDCHLYIQTHTPEHLVFRSLKEPDRFYRSDLNARMAFSYPPYGYLVRYSYGHAKKFQAEHTAERVVDSLRKELTGLNGKATISDSYQLHPGYFRGRHWFGFMVKLQTDAWGYDLARLNKYIPSQWKIDPNPISLLSP